MNLPDKEFFLLAGSISTSTDNQLVDRAHEFVKAFVHAALTANAGLVIYLASEPVNEDGKPMTFDWAVVREIDAVLSSDSADIRLKIVTSAAAQQNKMNTDQRLLINRLVARNVAEVVHLDDDTVTGGNIGDEQTEVATAMIALGGGKGVADRAKKMVRKHRPVFALDLQIGANSEDGQGALQILKSFTEQPLTYFPFTGDEVVKKLPALSLQEPAYDLPTLAQKIVEKFSAERKAQALAAPPDVLVLTALPIELAAAKLAFGVPEDAPMQHTSMGVHTWRSSVQRQNGSSAICTLASFGTAGNDGAAAMTSMLLTELRPKHVLMLGIAAGLRDKCKLADVVLSERVVAYNGAAVLEGGKVEARPEMSRPKFRVRQDMSSYLATPSLASRLASAAQALEFSLPAESPAGPVSTVLKPAPSTLASGELLLRDPEKFRMMRELHGKTEVAEMEAAGIFTACEQHDVPILVVRGISDFGDSNKDNTFHDIAAKAAAIVTADYVAHGLTTGL
jgi:nucleoside phosphorylase